MHEATGEGTTRALARLIIGQSFLHACMSGMRMAAPLLALREGYSAMAVGVLLALFALTQIFLSLPAGRYADRHGLRRPVTLSVASSVTATALAAAWPVFPVLCLSALMIGGATGAAAIAVQRHAGRLASGPTQLRQVFSWLSIGPAFSNFAGPLLAGLLIDHAGFRRLMIVNWLLSSCWDVHTFVMPVLGHERHLTASAIGTVLGAFAIAAMVVRILLPLIAARFEEARIVGSAMAAAAVLFGVYPFMGTALTMGLCSVLLGLALGAVQPMIMSTLHQITPEHRHGEAIGLRLMAINASSVLMPMLFGAAGALVGVSGVFWAVGAMVGSGTWMGLRISAPSEPSPAAPPEDQSS